MSYGQDRGGWLPPSGIPSSGGPPNPRDAQANRGTAWGRRQPYWWQYPRESPPAPVTSGLAIASLILAILWVGGIGSLLAVIFGAVALSRIGRSGGYVRGRGIAVAGTIIGVVGLVATTGVLVLGALVARQLATHDEKLGQAVVLASPARDGMRSLRVERFTVTAAATTPVLGKSHPTPGKKFATVWAEFCAGAGGSQTGPDLTWLQLQFSGGATVAPTVIDVSPQPLSRVQSLSPRKCVLGSVTYQVRVGTRPTAVEWLPYVIGPRYKWAIPLESTSP